MVLARHIIIDHWPDFALLKLIRKKKYFKPPLPAQATTDAIDLADNLPWLRPADRPAEKKITI
jgi:hypothetical protein